jgi:hypothetical protein
LDHRQAPESSSKVQEVIEAARSNLSDGEFQELEDLTTDYEDIFATGSEDYGRTDRVYHRIDTGDGMQRHGIIEESESPWPSTVVLVRKKNELRFCVDCRKLNNVTKKDCFPLPRIDNTLDTLSGAKWFSTLDLKSGYWQVDVHPDDREETAFSTGSLQSCHLDSATLRLLSRD